MLGQFEEAAQVLQIAVCLDVKNDAGAQQVRIQ